MRKISCTARRVSSTIIAIRNGWRCSTKMPLTGFHVTVKERIHREISLVFDDKHRLTDRIGRLESGLAHAQSPPSKTKRLVSNVQIETATENAATVSSGFILYELRRGKERVFAGRYEHGLHLIDGTWKIASKKVVLMNNDEVIDNLTFIV